MGCQEKETDINIELKNCINSEILSFINGLENFAEVELTPNEEFDYFDTIAKFERKLIEYNFLESKSKSSYIKLIKEFDSQKFSMDLINLIYDDESLLAFLNYNFIVNENIYSNCPYNLMREKKKGIFNDEVLVYNKIQAKGFESILPEIREYCDLVEFKSDIERLRLTYLLYSYMNLEFWNKRDPIPELIEKDGLFYEKQD